MKFYILFLFFIKGFSQDPCSRFAIVSSNLQTEQQKEELRQYLDRAKDAIKEFISTNGGACVDVIRVKMLLSSKGFSVGEGATFAYWKWRYPQYESFNHTAVTIIFKGKELVLDPTHKQFRGVDPLDEDIICLPAKDWMNELVTRTKGQNPVLDHQLRSGESLYTFVCPECTKPKLSEQQKKAIEEFDKLDDIRLKVDIRREVNDRRRERCIIF
ncbi:hypothetical protein HUE46_04115 [Flavobacterium columnare]|uniref:hypothetical protein n=1 Tax=Flavobacterium columnare TaxID=996 RepID=UPI001781226D|nr:hypothetical protein [Flavobacterium columnare]QOG89263.1 hypothetical protein HUE41_04115 [Flavobacterium columnare]QOG91922.1 hypothetical protein HUE42_04110 [Flavobacterium columnare]QOG94586.1 hypothetical protein HUE43_04115 [Flavobacterium columnare]QOG97245.1 hypothetical protein HUE44_04110 [Flavobacterium columnare]QOG99903.1 hypothetical protein HUE45_04110 [Flavobacterium columnare]